MTEKKAEIGIFGGTGIYDSGMLQDSKEITIDTPYGKTSDSITIGNFHGTNIAFMPRHGKKHTIPPHMINYRANIWAFKELGVKRIIAPSAVGSLKEDFQPGNFALPAQFLDFTKSRETSFSENGRVIHISVAEPFCPELQKAVIDSAENQDVILHKNCTYVCIEGPRFSTKAESKFFKSTGAVSVSTVTDYDVWAEKPVTAKEVLETLSKNVEKTKELLKVLIDKIPETKSCNCEKALSEAEF